MPAGPRPTGPRSDGFCVCAPGPTRSMLGVVLFALAGVPGTGPGSEEQKQARIGCCPDFMALLRVEVSDCSGARRLGRPTLFELDFAVDDDKVGVLVDLVL